MQLKLIYFLLITFSPFCLMSQGMWLPMNLEGQESNMVAKGMKMSASDIYSVNNGSLKDAIVHFGGYCTGEVISSKGLVLTNHHCGYSAIQSHSSIDDDYLKDGFWALSEEMEKPNDGLYVDFIVSIEDVSNEVLVYLDSGMTEKEAFKAVLNSHQTQGLAMRSEVRSIYYGNQFILIVSQRFSDVRLVGAPPSAVGKFGADTDNWVWPRHTGDFSMFRIYTAPDGSPSEYSNKNIPMVSKNPLTISLSGVNEGDFSMIYGALILGGLGVLSILAALRYTIGRNAYGYKGLGDAYVMLFFGYIGVLGVAYLLSHSFQLSWLLPATFSGLMAAAVLNLNNLRDHENDALSGKNTLVVRLGFKKAKSYQVGIIITSWALLLVFLLGAGELKEWRGGIWYVLIAFIHLKHVVFVMQNNDPKLLDPELKKISLTSFVVALFMILSVTV